MAAFKCGFIDRPKVCVNRSSAQMSYISGTPKAGYPPDGSAAHDDDDLDIGEPLADAPREIAQIVIRSQRCRTGDRDRQVLALLVEAVKEDQLLPTMRGIVERIHVDA